MHVAVCAKVFRTTMPYYAVRNGRNPGVYTSWDACKDQVNKFPKAAFKKFSTMDEANSFVGQTDNYTSSYSSSSSYSPPRARSSYASGSHTSSYAGSSYSPRSYTSPSYSSSYSSKSYASSSAGSSYSSKSYSTSSAGSSHSSSGPGKMVQSHRRHTAPYSTNKSTKENQAAEVYTDGGCYHNGTSNARAGIGVYWEPNSKWNVSERLPGRQTNNRAEIWAAQKAVEQAKSRGIKDLVVHTDSEFLCKAMNSWVNKWEQNDWRLVNGGPVKNEDDFKALKETCKGVSVKWNHVRGHQGLHGNEEADKLANAGASKPAV